MEILWPEGRKAKWTGIKAIKNFRIVYVDEMSEHLLDPISWHLKRMPRVLTDLFTGRDRESVIGGGLATKN